jgi:alkaline phosphatase D
MIAASCCKLQQTNPQPVWKEIQDERPDVLLLLGDNIYLDHDHHSDPAALQQELRRLYDAQLAEPSFAGLLADIRGRGGSILSIYDDHDFLGNNRYGGDHPPGLRVAARAELVRALAPPRTGEDVYSVTKSDLAHIVVLDERFYRREPSASKTDRDAILGAQQWRWFEDIVAKSGDKYLIVASSTTYHEYGDESWEQYPSAFNRMRALLGQRRGAMIVSGDVHRNALYDDSGVMEIVTSGVARNGIVFGGQRRNYGVLTFGNESVRAQLRSLKAGWRFDVTIPRNLWSL